MSKVDYYTKLKDAIEGEKDLYVQQVEPIESRSQTYRFCFKTTLIVKIRTNIEVNGDAVIVNGIKVEELSRAEINVLTGILEIAYERQEESIKEQVLESIAAL